MRCSHLNKALVVNEENVDKAEFLAWLHISIFNHWACENRALVISWFGFTVSEADLLVESQLCGIISPKGLFGVVSPFSRALHIPRGFSDRRFETAPYLRVPKHIKLVLAKRQSTSNQSFRFGN